MSSKRVRKKQWKQAGETQHCVLCGKQLWTHAKNYVSGKHGQVCHTCLHTGYRMIQYATPKEKSESHMLSIQTPSDFVRELDRFIAGQEEAKRAVALAMWKQQLRAAGSTNVPASHLLLYGPTGCGKTFLASKAAQFAQLPYCVFDATTLSETGYKGRDAIDILKDYYECAKGHLNRNWGIIILDEADKLAAKGSSDRQTYCRATQHALLKLLEGTTHEEIDSANLLFILCGAFTDIGNPVHCQTAPIGFMRELPSANTEPNCTLDHFVAFGMEKELLGRISGFTPIHPLAEDALIHILLDTESSPFLIYRNFFRERGVELRLPEQDAYEIARRALRLGTGARALKSELDKIMEPLMFQLAAGELEGSEKINVLGV